MISQNTCLLEEHSMVPGCNAHTFIMHLRSDADWTCHHRTVHPFAVIKHAQHPRLTVQTRTVYGQPTSCLMVRIRLQEKQWLHHDRDAQSCPFHVTSFTWQPHNSIGKRHIVNKPCQSQHCIDSYLGRLKACMASCIESLVNSELRRRLGWTGRLALRGRLPLGPLPTGLPASAASTR